MYDSYADVLESYIIAEEGIMDTIKKAGGIIYKGALKILEVIKTALKRIASKFMTLIRGKRNNTHNNDNNDRIKELTVENEKLKKEINEYKNNLKDKDNEIAGLNARSTLQASKIRELEGAVEDRDIRIKDMTKSNDDMIFKAIDRIKELKETIKKNNEEIETLKNDASKNKNDASKNKNIARIKNFQALSDKFILLVSNLVDRGYSAIPKAFSEIQKNSTMDEALEDKVYNLIDDIPSMSSTNWSYMYKILKFSYLPEFEKGIPSYHFNLSDERVYKTFIEKANKCVEIMEKLVKRLESTNNNMTDTQKSYYQKAMNHLTKPEGFIPMLKSSVSLVEQIINIYR